MSGPSRRLSFALQRGAGSGGAGRRLALDAARGAAVLAMFGFHLIWDLGHFGYIDPAFPFSPGVRQFGHAIALGFLFIAGIALVLAMERSAPWPAFFRRLALVFGAAALVSAGTYAAFPEAYIFFGILHCIAAASLLAAPLLRLPAVVAAGAALAVFLISALVASPVFDAPPLLWVGLGTFQPLTNDYRPLFPWAGALFAGVAAAKFARLRAGAFPPFSPAASAVLRPPAWLGRHSLFLYLVHQPLFFAVFTAVAALAPAPAADADSAFMSACVGQCVASGGASDICESACRCTAQAAAKDPVLRDDSERVARIREAAARCVAAPK